MDIVVMAGQVQLSASGPQERFFTVDPDYSYFVETLKKHSNFSTEFVDIDPENNEADFGKTIRFKIPQNQGDLLKTLSVKMTLPEIVETAATMYIESVAHAIIEHVDLIIGGKVVQRLTSDYLQIYSEHNVTQTKQKALEQLIGKYPLRTSDKRVGEVIESGGGNSGIVIHNTLGLNSDESFFVDLPFYFYKHPELAVPLCAINKQEVEVEFKLRDAQDLVIKGDGSYIVLEETLKLKNFQLCTEVVFLDCTERIKIENTPIDFLMTQLQHDVFEVDVGINEGKFKLDFANPVKELYFVIQRQGSNVNAVDKTLQGNFVTTFDYDNTSNVQDGKFILYENLDYLTLSLDGQDIITEDTGNVIFLKAVQGAIHHSKTQLIRRFYSYSFALQPEEWYPTGQINFSLIKDQNINLSLTSCPDFSRQIRVYALSYNVLRVREGTGQTLFDSKQ
jgi:hypothetical protein|tara:strand:- start:4613 stop:5959 length:1347 start_codon:yes stop_codon:yes gene_type:complete